VKRVASGAAGGTKSGPTVQPTSAQASARTAARHGAGPRGQIFFGVIRSRLFLYGGVQYMIMDALVQEFDMTLST
jgi:hypothetical protein